MSKLAVKSIKTNAALLLLLFSLGMSGCQNLKPLPDGLSFDGELLPAHSVEFLADTAWIDEQGQRHLEQEIFDDVLQRVAEARKLILIDMFLFNDFMGQDSTPMRQISSELANALIQQKSQYPDMQIVLITDPVNTVYGGMKSEVFESLRAADVPVVVTDLDKLRDSNQVYSFVWRLFIKPFGNDYADTLANPFGSGRVSLRSYLKLLNFKANHRKVFISDTEDGLQALVTSANPHDGSSAHRNVALSFKGGAVDALLKSENAVLRLSGAAPVIFEPSLQLSRNGSGVKVLSESRIKETVLGLLASADQGEVVDLLMFYFSDRDIIEALLQAHQRGAKVRVLLDPNKDAFGREKNGIPNRPVASELHEAGVPVRWCLTQGEQCHGKMLLLVENPQASLTLGSANYTRRNLDDFNLETNVLLLAPVNEQAIVEAREHFERMWANRPGETYSVEYDAFADESLVKSWLYRFQEWSGLSTF